MDCLDSGHSFDIKCQALHLIQSIVLTHSKLDIQDIHDMAKLEPNASRKLASTVITYEKCNFE